MKGEGNDETGQAALLANAERKLNWRVGKVSGGLAASVRGAAGPHGPCEQVPPAHGPETPLLTWAAVQLHCCADSARSGHAQHRERGLDGLMGATQSKPCAHGSHRSLRVAGSAATAIARPGSTLCSASERR